MATTVVRADAKTSEALATLEQVVGRLKTQEGPVEVVRPKGASSVRQGEVYVIVLSAEGSLVSHRKLVGHGPDLRELRLRLAGAEAAVDGLVLAPVGGPQLTDDEAALLDAGGLPAPDPQVPGALEQTRIELDLLVQESLTLEQAAKALGVGTSRLRQRLAPGVRTLYGIKDGRTWRLPKFQFVRPPGQKLRLVRGIDEVLPSIRPEVAPLVVAKWFSTPHQDLVVGDTEKRVTPLAWLSAGHAPTAVAQLANEL